MGVCAELAGTVAITVIICCGCLSTAVVAADSQRGAVDAVFAGIPGIKEVQAAAVNYAEVDSSKILRWRRQAATRAWLPQLKLGVDYDNADRWHWEGGSTTKEYDDILRKGKADYAWDVSLTWDLADLVWNDAQTSIDTRSRLMVMLRENILEQVTRLYFEYVRAAAEYKDAAQKDAAQAAKTYLRLRELSAYLDAFTNGYFSAHLSR